MDIYYVNTKSQDNGDHEIHKLSCSFMPLPEHRLFVGYFNNCHEALKEAKKTYPTADGCRYCCQECNTK